MARYRRLVMQLQTVLEEEANRDRTRQLLSSMLGDVTIGRDVATGEVFAELDEPASGCSCQRSASL